MNEDLKKLFEGSELSDKFKESVGSVFEQAVKEAVEVEKAKIVEEYEKKLEEEKETLSVKYQEKADTYIAEEVMPQINKYLDYSVKEFVKENKIAVVDSLKVESAEAFLKGMIGLTESFNVKIPEGQSDIVKSLEKKLAESDARFNEALTEKDKLQETINKTKMDVIVAEQVKELTESQKEKFVQAIAKVKYRTDEQYKSAISDLYESYFPSGDGKKVVKETIETKTKEVNEDSKWLSEMISRV